MTCAEIVDHLERYAESFRAPVRCGVRVKSVDPLREGQGYSVSTESGLSYITKNVVVATGSFQFPKPSPLRANLPPEIRQLHSSQYRNPGALAAGAVLVIGSADSGSQIAEDLRESGRQASDMRSADHAVIGARTSFSGQSRWAALSRPSTSSLRRRPGLPQILS